MAGVFGEAGEARTPDPLLNGATSEIWTHITFKCISLYDCDKAIALPTELQPHVQGTVNVA